MAAYVIAHLEITDPEPFGQYREQVPALIEKHGGRYLIRGGTAETLEGAWPVPRLVVIEFESGEAAKRFYNSPEYQAILPLRLAGAKGDLAIVQGVP